MSEAAARAFGEFFALPAARLSDSGVHVVPHARLEGWNGAWIFWTEKSVIVSLPSAPSAPPSAGLDAVRDRASRLSSEVLRSEAAVRELFGADAALVIGPAYWGALEPERFRPVESREVRPLDGQEAAVRALFERVEPSAREAYGMEAGASGQRGLFRERELVAVAGWRDWGTGVGDPAVLTASTERGQGLGRKVLSAVVGEALERGDTVLYQTLRANRAAVRLAGALGFRDYATHLAVRFA